VQEQSIYGAIKISNWGIAFQNTRFRNKLIVGLVLLSGVLFSLPSFFSFIEQRNGFVLNDWMLRNIGPVDVSVPVFIVIWGTTLFFLFRCISKPSLFINAIYCLVLLSLLRMLAIYLVPLNPPESLIPLKDPLTSLTYGGKNVFFTKDLFFSGHTSNILMLGLCFEKKTDRWLGIIASLTVGMLVLLQHVHYSIDVIAALLFTVIIVRIGKKAATH
jgi:PAP2 superfamily C-terminal